MKTCLRRNNGFHLEMEHIAFDTLLTWHSLANLKMIVVIPWMSCQGVRCFDIRLHRGEHSVLISFPSITALFHMCLQCIFYEKKQTDMCETTQGPQAKDSKAAILLLFDPPNWFILSSGDQTTTDRCTCVDLCSEPSAFPAVTRSFLRGAIK